MLLLIPVGIGAIFPLLSWFARTYTVGADELTIDEGIVRRRRRVVPYRRVQQIDMDQKLIPQLLRVGVLTIETAGTAGGKVKLGLLDVRVARGLRSHVLERRAALQGTLRAPPGPAVPGPGDPKPGITGPGLTAPSPWPGAPAIPPPEAGTKVFQPERVVLHLTPKRLVLAAATHHNVIASLPILLLAGVGIGALTVPANRDVGAFLVLAIALGIGLGVWVALVAVVVLNQVLTQYGYTLSEQGDDLHLRFGLLQVRNLTIPRRRVQHLTVIDNPVRRALGLVGVQLHSAAPPDRERTAFGAAIGQVRFDIPVVGRADLDELLHALMGGDWHIPELTPRPRAARRRAVIRRVGILALVLVIPACAFLPGSLALLGLAMVLGVPWGLLAHRRAGYADVAELAVLARGVLHHRVDLVPHSRLQSTSTLQNPMQRLSHLRTLHLNVAGRSADPRLSDLPDDAALTLARALPRRSVAGSR